MIIIHIYLKEFIIKTHLYSAYAFQSVSANIASFQLITTLGCWVGIIMG